MNETIYEIIDSASRQWWGKLQASGQIDKVASGSLAKLITDHFGTINQPSHVCRPTITLALELLNCKSATIVETGTAAYGTQSSVLFDGYVCSFGGRLLSVDSRIEPMLKTQALCSRNSAFYCNDSVSFLKQVCREIPKVDLLYLDSWDVDLSDPLPSALHGLNEYLHAIPMIKSGTILLIDDTPRTFANWAEAHGTSAESKFVEFERHYGFKPGKGSLVKSYLESQNVGSVVSHEYQYLYMFH